jgi:hypothetical protein
MTPTGDPNGPVWNGWLNDEANKIADCYYDK